MNIILHEVSIAEIFDGYRYFSDKGTVAYSGKLNIHLSYQRIYSDQQQENVIKTILSNFPLGIMYWSKSGNTTFELIDGIKRTLSICQYLAGKFTVEGQYFYDLSPDQQRQITTYKLIIYICDGTSREKLNWFNTINFCNTLLTKQELRNSIYTGSWLTDTKKHFSKPGCDAQQIGSKYLNGNAIRQDYLYTALSWISDRDNISSEEYMEQHQHDKTCDDLLSYFSAVINWVESLFPHYRPIMKGQPWGYLYNHYHHYSDYNPDFFESKIKELLFDDEVLNNKGVYQYLFTHDEKFLHLRTFSQKDKLKQYTLQAGICPICKSHFNIDEMVATHIKPWRTGGKTIPSNLQVICNHCFQISKI